MYKDKKEVAFCDYYKARLKMSARLLWEYSFKILGDKGHMEI